MAEREILQIGNPLLRRRSSKVTHFGAALSRLVEDMIESMQAANGVGLAAPQIGVNKRVIIVEMPGDESYPHPGERWIMCNPDVVKVSRETEIGQEGCLSVAGYVGMVERPASALIRGQDIRGKPYRVKAEGFLARAFLHEIDHLNGVLYVDLAEEGTVMTVEEYEQLIQEQQAEQETKAEEDTPVHVSAC